MNITYINGEATTMRFIDDSKYFYKAHTEKLTTNKITLSLSLSLSEFSLESSKNHAETD